jgi:L-lactate dehydrogenase complex protein LldG
LVLKSADPADSDVGISLAYGAVAETGSLIMTPQDGRRAQLLPPVHVVWVEEKMIFPMLYQALSTLGKDLPSAVGLHSGPSKSADIGQILVKGVHGPGRLIAVLLADKRNST